MKKRKAFKLTAEEKAIEESFKRGEWQKMSKLETNKLVAMARATVLARKKVMTNIRIQPDDMNRLLIKAQSKGVPYQELLSSIIHQYVTGQLKEKDTVLLLKKLLRQR